MVKIRFARAVLHGLKPRKVRYDVQDSEGSGLILRISPQGRKTWMVNYRSDAWIPWYSLEKQALKAVRYVSDRTTMALLTAKQVHAAIERLKRELLEQV